MRTESTVTKLFTISNRHSAIFAPILPIAAIIWFSVSEEIKIPTEIKIAPISVIPAKLPQNDAQPNTFPALSVAEARNSAYIIKIHSAIK